MESKYRICKNKYGWYKIEERIVTLVSKGSMYSVVEFIAFILLALLIPILILLILLGVIRDFIDIDIFIEKYTKKEKQEWVDVWGYIEKFRTRQEAQEALFALEERDQRRKEQNNNEWECDGGY